MEAPKGGRREGIFRSFGKSSSARDFGGKRSARHHTPTNEDDEGLNSWLEEGRAWGFDSGRHDGPLLSHFQHGRQEGPNGAVKLVDALVGESPASAITQLAL